MENVEAQKAKESVQKLTRIEEAMDNFILSNIDDFMVNFEDDEGNMEFTETEVRERIEERQNNRDILREIMEISND